MDTSKIAAILLMAAGVLGLAYGGYSYTEDTHEANVGSLTRSFDDMRSINFPAWAGVGMLLVGGLIFPGRMRRS